MSQSTDIKPTVEHGVPADERIPYELAAKALNVSRRTIERMVTDGRLERDTTATDANQVSRITRRSLVACLGDRREDVAAATRHGAAVSSPAGLDVGRLVADLVEARADAAGLRERLKLLEVGADEARRREDLIATLVGGTWRERRKARRKALVVLTNRGSSSKR